MHPISQGAKNELIDLFSKIPNGPFGIVTAMSIVESFPTSSEGLGDSTSEPENRWIPVTAKLPETLKQVMLFDGDEVSEGFLSENGRFYYPNAYPCCATHWKPLPLPPVT